jgi:hypothetical protein
MSSPHGRPSDSIHEAVKAADIDGMKELDVDSTTTNGWTRRQVMILGVLNLAVLLQNPDAARNTKSADRFFPAIWGP